MSAISNPRLTPVERPSQPKAPEASPPQPKRSLGKGLLIVGLIGAGGLVSWQVWLKPKAPDPAALVVSVRTVKVSTGPLERTARISGQTSSREYFNITAPIMRGPDSGRAMVLLFLVPSGSKVKKGDLLAQIDSQSLVDHIDDIGDDIQKAEADIAKRKAEQMIDIENLNQQILIAKTDFEKATLDAKPSEVRTPIDQELLKLAVDEAAARYKQTQSDVKHKQIAHKAEIRILEITAGRHHSHQGRHKTDLVRFTMKSPMDGLAVVQATYRGGEWGLVQQGDQVGPGQLFMKVVNPDNMQVEGFINQAESDQFRIGQRTNILFDAFGGMQFRGKIYSLGAMATGGFRQQSYIRNMPVKITIEGADPRLIPDLSASVDVILQRQEDAKKIPLAAVHTEGNQQVVYVKRSGKFEKRPVTLGMQTATHVAVTSGLEDGEEIALSKPVGA